MTTMLKPLVAGNWKMNGLRHSHAILQQVIAGYSADMRARVDLLVCPPATLLHSFSVSALGSRVMIGAQDAHAQSQGAHTGDISAPMIVDCGASHVILGHSERRQNHKETNADVAAKAKAVWLEGLNAIICVGETNAERETGKTLDVIKRQLQGSLPKDAPVTHLTIAYEPVWAIGTGLTPTVDDVAHVHAFIRGELKKKLGKNAVSVRILYGGSVKPANAKELLSIADVNGALVGGASLVAADFLAIAHALV